MEDLTLANRPSSVTVSNAAESSKSAVSWAAILSGAVVAAATSLLLFVLATGLGLTAVSPWPDGGASAGTLAGMTAIAFIMIQWISASVGGYITGRLRLKWVGLHTHEVFFRDTAHGFITWAVATLLIGSTLAAGAASLIGMGAHAAGAVASGVVNTGTNAATASGVGSYELEALFRSGSGAGAKTGDATDARGQAAHILARAMTTGGLPAADRTYLAQLVVSQTGASESDAQRRVDDTVAQLKASQDKTRAMADTARKATELMALFTALSMLIGAFIASVSAALGGRLRDLHA
jgi:hypothetical protein